MLINITGGHDLGCTKSAKPRASFTTPPIPDANIIFGAVLDERMKDEVKITVIATGFDKKPEPSVIAAALSASTARSDRKPLSRCQTWRFRLF